MRCRRTEGNNLLWERKGSRGGGDRGLLCGGVLGEASGDLARGTSQGRTAFAHVRDERSELGDDSVHFLYFFLINFTEKKDLIEKAFFFLLWRAAHF